MDGGGGGLGSGAGEGGGGGGITSSAQPLSLHVEDIDAMTIEVIIHATMVSIEITATVLGCVDGGVSDAGACGAQAELLPPEELTPDIFGMPAYFSGGATSSQKTTFLARRTRPGSWRSSLAATDSRRRLRSRPGEGLP